MVAQREVCVAVVALEGCEVFVVVAVQRRLQVRYVEAVLPEIAIPGTMNVIIIIMNEYEINVYSFMLSYYYIMITPRD